MKRALLVVCLSLLALGAGLGWLLASESGLNWAYRHASVRLPGLLTVERLSGRLLGPIVLERFDYRDGPLRLAAERIALRWNPLALLDGELDIDALELRALDVELPPADDAAAPGVELPALAPPLPVRLGGLDIDGLRLQRAGERQVIERVRLGGRWHGDGLEIVSAEINAADYGVSATGTLSPAGDWPHRLRLQWRWRLPSGAELAGSGHLDGDLGATSLTQAVSGALTLDARLDVTDPLARPRWRLDARLDDFDGARLDPGLPGVTGAVTLNAAGDLDSLGARGELRLDSSPIGPFETGFSVERLALDAGGGGILFDALALDNDHGKLESSGRLDWAGALAWAADIRLRDVDPARFAADWPGRLDAEAEVSGRLAESGPEVDVALRRLDGRLRDYPVSLAGRAQWSAERIELSDVRLVSAESALRVDGRVDEDLALDWALDSPDLGQIWPGARGRLAASGRLEGQRRAPRLSATLAGAGLGLDDMAAARLDGRIDVDLLDGEPWIAPDGRFAFTVDAGDLRLGDTRIASLGLEGDRDGISADLVNELGRVAVTLAGRPRDDGWQGTLRAAELALTEYGDWRLRAPAALSLSPGRIALDGACLAQQGGATLCASIDGGGGDWRIDGEAGGVQLAWLKRWLPLEFNATGELAADARLHYRAAGSLLGEARLRLSPGSVDLPLDRDRTQRLAFAGGVLDLRLAENGLRASATLGLREGETCAGEVEAPGANVLTLDPKRQAIEAELRCNLADLDLAEALLVEVDDLQGSAELDLRVSGSMAQPRVDGAARLANARFVLPRLGIRIDRLDAEATSGEADRLDFSAVAALADGRIEIDGQTQLDADAGWPTRLGLRGRRLDLAKLLEGRLPPGARIEGAVVADGELRLRLPDRLDGKLRLATVGGAFAYPLVEGEETRWALDEAVFEAVAGADGISATAAVAVDDNRLDGRLRLPGARPGALEPALQTLDASIDLQVPDLSPLGAWTGEIHRPSGRLQGRLEFDGTLAAPRMRVNARLDEAAMQVPRLGVALGPITASVVTEDNGELRLDAEIAADQGSLRITGSGQLDAIAPWPARIRVVGEDFPVARLDVARIDVSPDLTIDVSDYRIDVNGEVRVPFARLRPRDITTADRVSADAVVIGEEAQPARAWRITSRTRVILGDRVDFFGYGFDGKLGGNLVIDELPGQPTRGTGEITIISGRYIAYGQALEIENGRLLFTGGPIGNPGLDVVAVRRAGDVTAGLRVGGRLQQPELELFSVPAMGQTDALSYLLTGGPLETATSQQGSMMANAALAIGLSGGDRIARSLGDRFGFDELRVESSATGEQASLVVGRYLSPRLYVSYGVGLIESINTLNLRYAITPRWRIEAESGAEQGADLLYSIER